MRKGFTYLTFLGFVLLMVAGAPAESATINVTASATDILAADGACSLREAITNINNGIDTYADCTATVTPNPYGTSDTINLPAGTYTNAIAGVGEDLNATGDLDILVSVTINGAGAGTTIIDGGAIDRVFHMPGAVTVNISGVTVQNGLNSNIGGGISSYGTLTVDSSTISGNTTTGGWGGGIYNRGTLTVNNSTISGNTSANSGGGIWNYGGTLTVNNSTISGNSATYSGGGIYNGSATLTIDSTTISGNTAVSGGGIYSWWTLTVTNTTISGNTATYSGGGIYSYYATLTVTNSIIDGNSANTLGGGLLNTAGTANVDGTTINNNTAPAGAGCSGTITDNGGNYNRDGTCGFGPTLISPTGVSPTSTPTYTWSAMASATQYQLWVDNSSGSGVVQDWVSATAAGCGGGVGTCSYTPATAVAYGTVTWWVRGYNAVDGLGSWGGPMVFTVQLGAPPTAPAPVSPTGVIATSTPTYIWNAVAGATWYQLWVNDSSGSGVIRDWVLATAAGCAGGVGTCSYTSATAVAPGNASWWVRGYNHSDGLGAWGGPMAFTFQLGAPPATPAPVSPTGAVATSTPTYTWNAVAGAAWYQLWVNDSSGSGAIRDWVSATTAGCAGGVGTCSYTSPTAVAPGNASWWVRGYNTADGASAWGGPLTFTVPLGADALLAGLFPDAYLQACVDGYGWTYASEATGTLDCHGLGITNLTGMEHLTNLTWLKLWGNNSIVLDVSPLAGLTSLTYLNLNSNLIVDVSPLAGLTNLTTLYLEGNSIVDVGPLAGLTNLTGLWLDGNSIVDVSPLAGLTNLTDLFLDFNNSIVDVSPLAGLTNLTMLFLNNNSIVDVSPLAGLTNLTDLLLFSNSIGGQGVGKVDTLATLTSITALWLGGAGNVGMSCAELGTLIGVLGSPPVDTDGAPATADVAIPGTNCTNP